MIAVTACICITVIPLLLFLGYSLYQSYELQSRHLVQQRVFGARLAAATVASELNSIRVFGTWYSTAPKIRALVAEKKWAPLSRDMDRVVERLPSVVRVFASDAQGRLWADSPRKPDVHGVDFSFRDWFKGAMESQGPYLSHAYRRTAEPRIQVAAMAFPVHDRDDETVGVIVLQFSLDTVLSWAGNLETGGHLTFIDQYERSFEVDRASGEIVVSKTPLDLSSFPGAISDAGYSDVVVRNDEQTVAVYAGVPRWSWGVYIAESAETFFAGRDQELRTIVLIVGLVLVLCLASAGTAFVLLRKLANKERALSRANAELLSANRNLREFTHAVSHDLRAPLRAMNGFAEALVEEQADKLDDQSRHFLERIRTASHKLGQMIEDLLAVARIPQMELQSRQVDLSATAGDIVEELRAGDPDRDVDVTIEPDLTTRGDPSLLTLVLRNLLQNAWKFTRDVERAKIELGREWREGEPVYFIKDNGAGFDPQYADKLFTMFQRLHNETEFEGTGIGLATALQCIELHGGRIWAKGREGEGAVFRFTTGAG